MLSWWISLFYCALHELHSKKSQKSKVVQFNYSLRRKQNLSLTLRVDNWNGQDWQFSLLKLAWFLKLNSFYVRDFFSSFSLFVGPVLRKIISKVTFLFLCGCIFCNFHNTICITMWKNWRDILIKKVSKNMNAISGKIAHKHLFDIDSQKYSRLLCICW